jgi:25S rRNA (cytosine2278-C5)-methyltransferase
MGKPGSRKPLPYLQIRRVRSQAARIIARLLKSAKQKKNGSSIKTLTLGKLVQFKSATHAVVCETIKVLPLIRLLIKDVKLSYVDDDDFIDDDDDFIDDDDNEADEVEDNQPSENRKSSSRGKKSALKASEAFVLTYELLFGTPIKPNEDDDVQLNYQEKQIIAKTGEFKNQLLRRLKKEDVKTAKEFVEKMLPEKIRKIVNEEPMTRFARINKMKVKDNMAITKELEERGFRGVEICEHLGDGYLKFPKSCDRKKLSAMKIVKNGELVLQGKSSCMPAHALMMMDDSDEEKEISRVIRQSDVIDACAAPGNKTTQVASLLDRKQFCKVFAFEKDYKRAQRLRDTVDIYGCANKVVIQKKSFLDIDVNDVKYQNVRSILLDPSCSGSGTAQNRGDALMEYALKEAFTNDKNILVTKSDEKNGKVNSKAAAAVEGEDEGEEEIRLKRVMNLQKFQIDALSHALNFPSVLRVSYSTCSIYREENEEVVKKVLPLAKENGFQLSYALPKWPRRGFTDVLGNKKEAEKLVRVNPFEGDDCEGFFVAIFTRKLENCSVKISETNNFLDAKRKRKQEEKEKEDEVKPVLENETRNKKKKKNGGKKSALFR